MRTGAIFARGSCRALKWMAMLGVVFALGAGSAFAQGAMKAISIASVKIEAAGADGKLLEGSDTEIVITLNAKLPDTGLEGEDRDATLGVTLTVGGITDSNETGMAEATEDLRVNHAAVANNNEPITVTDFEEGQQVKRIPLVSLPDVDAVDETFTLTATLASTADNNGDEGTAGQTEITPDTAPKEADFTITDVDPQEYILKLKTAADKVSESGDFEVNLSVKPARPLNEALNLYVRLESENADDKLTTTNPMGGHPFNAAQSLTPITLTVMPKNPDGNRMANDVMLIASMFDEATGQSTDVIDLGVTIHDAQELPDDMAVTAMATMTDEDDDDTEVMSVTEGGMVYLTVTVDRGKEADKTDTQEDYSVTLSVDPAHALDVRLTPTKVDIPAGEDEQSSEMKVKLEALPDEDIGDEPIMVYLMLEGDTKANGMGTRTGMFPITIVDDTKPKVSVKMDAGEAIKDALGDPPMLNKGMSGQVMTAALFDWDPMAVSVTFGTSVEGAAVSARASGEMVTIMAEAEGEAKVTVTATATPTSSSLMVNPTQTQSDVAQLTFSVKVDLEALSVTVEAADPEIMEGGSTMITATASREVAMSDPEVMINLDVVGDAMLDMDSIMIAAGSMMGSATLTSTDDSEHESGEIVTVVYSGTGIMGSQQIAIAVMDDDDPPEPPAATVTAKSEAEVQAVFDSAVADARTGPDWYEGGTAAMVDMSELFNVADGASPAYSGVSSDEMVASATASGMMLTLMPMSEGMATITVTAVDSASGDSDTASGMVTVADLPLEVAVSAPAMVAEGGSVMITATANKMVDADVMVMLMRDGASSASEDDYTVGELMIAMGETTGTATLMATDDYDVEGDESLTLSAMVGDMSAGMVMIAIEDNDVDTTYTLSADPMMVMEGGTSTITATASQMVRENTEVMVMRDAASTAGDDDYSLDPVMITIMMGETAGTATLTATDDYDVEGNESLTLNGMVGDMAAGMVMVTIEDDDADTTYTLSASEAMVAEGGSVTITATASQMVRENTEVMVMRDAASTAGADDYSVAPPLITIMMGETTGSLTLTATDDHDVEGDESLTLNGMVGDMAAGSVMIAIHDNDVVSAFTLSGPEDMNLVEGKSYMLTVTADPAVQMDTEVMIMRDRSMSDADDADFTAEPVMIMAGETMGTTMLMVTEDGMDDAGHAMPEMLVVFGMVDGMETNSLTFYTWDMAVPALPLIAQLLLAAFLAIGGYRRYLRR